MDESQLSRRKLLGVTTGAGVALAGGLMLHGEHAGRALAQDEVAGAATPVAMGDPLPEEFGTETNWPVENLDVRATRDVQGTSISADTVDQLGEAWAFPVAAPGSFGALTAHPTVVGDMVYLQDAAANVYAINKETGEQAWANMYNDVVPSGGPNGIAAAYGLLFTTIGGLADVVALKPDTGEEVWRTNIKGSLNEGITTSPLVYDSVVYVSTIPGSSEAFYGGGQRGVIHAIDAATGGVLWYFDTTTDNLWGNPRVNSGGGFWHPPTADEDGKIYFPIANPAPYPGTEEFPFASSRQGDNLYTDSVLKMDPATATLDWYTQVRQGDVWDLDNQLSPVLADVDGKKLAFASGKHGVAYALDRDTGEIVWRTPVGTHKNDELTYEDLKDRDPNEAIEVMPGTLGGVETPMAFSADKNLLILPVYELASTYIGSGFDPNTPFDFTSATGFLVALNATDGSVVWQTELASGPLAGATITNDIVWSSGLDGAVQAFSLEDGSEVFTYQTTAGVNAPLAVSGDYVFIPAGGPLIPSSATSDPAPTAALQLIAIKIGGTGLATPEGEAPASDATPTLEDTGNDPGTNATPTS